MSLEENKSKVEIPTNERKSITELTRKVSRQGTKKEEFGENKIVQELDDEIEKKSKEVDPNQAQKSNQLIFTGEKCDGCFKPLAVIYCLNCENNFCSECNNLAHAVPALQSHERVNLKDLQHIKILCCNHHQPLKYYCESCCEPICSECADKGSHSNKLHKISAIVDSFRKRFNFLDNLVSKDLMQKQDQLYDQISVIEEYSEHVKSIKSEIERETKKEYIKIIENLRNEEGKKLSVLQYESSVIQKEIEKINDISKFLNEQNSPNVDMISFLIKYKKLEDNIETCLVKPIKKNIDIRFDDFPTEVEDRRNKLLKLEKIKKLIHIKDDIIWNLINDKKDRFETEMKILREKHENEQNELLKIIESLNKELRKYHTVCHYCGIKNDENTVNTPCNRNLPESMIRGLSNSNSMVKEFHTHSQVPSECVGTKRHYFAKSKYENVEKRNNNDFEEKREIGSFGSSINFFQSNAFSGNEQGRFNEHNLKESVASRMNNGKDNGITDVEDTLIIEKMKKLAEHKSSNVFDIFQIAFKESDIVSSDNIKPFLRKVFNFDEAESKKFLSWFKRSSKSNVLNLSSSKGSENFEMSEIFKFLRNKNLNKNFSDSKMEKFTDTGVIFADKISEWVFKVAKVVSKNKINLFTKLSEEDKNDDGFITSNDLRIAFIKLKLNINTNDIESMINYFNFSDHNMVNIQEFTKNFMAHLNLEN